MATKNATKHTVNRDMYLRYASLIFWLSKLFIKSIRSAMSIAIIDEEKAARKVWRWVFDDERREENLL